MPDGSQKASDQRVDEYFSEDSASGRSGPTSSSRWTGSLIWLGIAVASSLAAAWAAYTLAASGFDRGDGVHPPLQLWDRVAFGSLELVVIAGAVIFVVSLGIAAWQAVRSVRQGSAGG
jgi:hypothetical protein